MATKLERPPASLATIRPTAYLATETELWRVIRLEPVGSRPAMYRVWMENARGTFHEESRSWHFRQRWFSVDAIRKGFVVIREAEKDAA